MRSRISRLEKLYTDTLIELQRLGEREEKIIADFLATAYKERYHHGIFDLAKSGEIAVPVAAVQPNNLKKVLAARWQGGNYSSRIWANKEKLSGVIKQTITSGLHRGLSVPKMSKLINDKMNAGISNAERLVRTEMNFVQNHAAKDSLQAAGLDEYEFIAVLDHRTTPRCQALDGTMYLLEEYSVGTNAPPMHPRCRSTISAVLGEKTGTRIARNKEGKNIQVPASMTYPDYKKVYLDKSMTLEQWREKDKIRDAAEKEKIKEQEARGADIIRRLANGEKVTPNRLISSEVYGKVLTNNISVVASEKRTFTNSDIFNTPKIPINILGIGTAVIPTAKLTKYALNTEGDANKARAFDSALGYNLSNVEKLVENIIEHINEYEVIYRDKTPYGELFQITMELKGVNDKVALVTTAWIIDSEKGEIRLTSIYVDKRRRKE